MPINPARFGLFAALALATPWAIGPTPAAAANSSDATMFKLDSVTFVGNQRVPTDTLETAAGLHKGDKVNRDSIVEAFQRIVAEYGKQNVGGTITPTMEVQSGRMKVVFTIAEAAAPAAVLKDPLLDHETFTGNVKVKNEQLAAALTIKPGTGVTRDMVVADENAISAVYKAAKVAALIQPKATNTNDGHVDLNFQITENPPKK